MSKFFKNKFVKIFTSILIICLVYIYLCYLFVPKNLNDKGFEKYYRGLSIKNEELNSLDVLFYGNSDLGSAIIPMEIYKETGITSFLRWGNQQTINSIHKDIKEDIKIQNPKLIVLEVDCLYYPNKLISNNDFYSNFLLAPFAYHTRWKNIEFNDFIPFNKYERDFHKGYYYSTLNGNYVFEDYMGNSNKSKKIEKSVIKKVEQIKKICNKIGAELLFIEAPSPSSWSMEKHNGVKDFANKLGINFIDFNLNLHEFEFDYANDFRDYGNHCNIKGAKKITKYLSNFLKENYNLKDRRLEDNKKFKNWQKDIKKCEEIYG